MIFVSTTIPYASRAGTDFRCPSTRSDALALENPSLDADVGILMKARLRRKPQYFAASMTLPPPMPMIACVFADIENARLVRSSRRTVSSSWYSSTSTPDSFNDSMTSMPNMSINPLPKSMTTFCSCASIRYDPRLSSTPGPIFRMTGIAMCLLSIILLQSI